MRSEGCGVRGEGESGGRAGAGAGARVKDRARAQVRATRYLYLERDGRARGWKALRRAAKSTPRCPADQGLRLGLGLGHKLRLGVRVGMEAKRLATRARVMKQVLK